MQSIPLEEFHDLCRGQVQPMVIPVYNGQSIRGDMNMRFVKDGVGVNPVWNAAKTAFELPRSPITKRQGPWHIDNEPLPVVLHPALAQASFETIQSTPLLCLVRAKSKLGSTHAFIVAVLDRVLYSCGFGYNNVIYSTMLSNTPYAQKGGRVFAPDMLSLRGFQADIVDIEPFTPARMEILRSWLTNAENVSCTFEKVAEDLFEVKNVRINLNASTQYQLCGPVSSTSKVHNCISWAHRFFSPERVDCKTMFFFEDPAECKRKISFHAEFATTLFELLQSNPHEPSKTLVDFVTQMIPALPPPATRRRSRSLTNSRSRSKSPATKKARVDHRSFGSYL